MDEEALHGHGSLCEKAGQGEAVLCCGGSWGEVAEEDGDKGAGRRYRMREEICLPSCLPAYLPTYLVHL